MSRKSHLPRTMAMGGLVSLLGSICIAGVAAPAAHAYPGQFLTSQVDMDTYNSGFTLLSYGSYANSPDASKAPTVAGSVAIGEMITQNAPATGALRVTTPSEGIKTVVDGSDTYALLGTGQQLGSSASGVLTSGASDDSRIVKVVPRDGWRGLAVEDQIDAGLNDSDGTGFGQIVKASDGSFSLVQSSDKGDSVISGGVTDKRVDVNSGGATTSEPEIFAQSAFSNYFAGQSKSADYSKFLAGVNETNTSNVVTVQADKNSADGTFSLSGLSTGKVNVLNLDASDLRDAALEDALQVALNTISGDSSTTLLINVNVADDGASIVLPALQTSAASRAGKINVADQVLYNLTGSASKVTLSYKNLTGTIFAPNMSVSVANDDASLYGQMIVGSLQLNGSITNTDFKATLPTQNVETAADIVLGAPNVTQSRCGANNQPTAPSVTMGTTDHIKYVVSGVQADSDATITATVSDPGYKIAVGDNSAWTVNEEQTEATRTVHLNAEPDCSVIVVPTDPTTDPTTPTTDPTPTTPTVDPTTPSPKPTSDTGGGTDNGSQGGTDSGQGGDKGNNSQGTASQGGNVNQGGSTSGADSLNDAPSVVNTGEAKDDSKSDPDVSGSDFTPKKDEASPSPSPSSNELLGQNNDPNRDPNAPATGSADDAPKDNIQAQSKPGAQNEAAGQIADQAASSSADRAGILIPISVGVGIAIAIGTAIAVIRHRRKSSIYG